MDLSRGSLITYGGVTLSIPKLNEQTSFEQIRQHVRDLFANGLPRDYRIVYYDSTRLAVVDLEDQLRQGFNPFRMRSPLSARTAAGTPSYVHFYITNDSPTHSNVSSVVEMSTFHHNDDSSSSGETTSQSLQTYRTTSPSELEACVPMEFLNRSSAIDYGAIEDSSRHLPSRSQMSTFQSNIENLLSSRLYFSLDVMPNQKDHYRSDQFSVDPTKFNGRIARVQGIKEEHQKMTQVLPRLRIPSVYCQSNATLLVFVAHEQFIGGMRVWCKHLHKGFLPENYTKDTETVNPIEFDFNRDILTGDGDFKLNLTMITKWNKSSNEVKEFYRLSEEETLRVHQATHDSSSPRLLCVLRQNGRIIWETFCLSDFIRSRKPPKQAYSKVTGGRSSSPVSKRSKNDG